MDLPIYEIELKDGEYEAFTKVSLVKDPAISQNLIFFSKEKPTFFTDEEKKVIYCVAMRPNVNIFRSEIDGIIGNKGYVFYTPETVEKFQLQLRRNLNDSKVNINHNQNENANGIFCFENWIVKNKEIDKSKAIGLDAENGDLIMGFKVDNSEVWEQCKRGELDGLSIEAFFNDAKKVSNFKTEINMTKLEKVNAFFKDLFAGEEDKTPEQIAEEEAKAKEAMAEGDAPAPEDAPGPADDNAKLLEENAKLKEQVAELETKLATIEADKVKEETNLETMKKEFSDLKNSFEKFKSETPAAAPVKNLPREESIPYEQMTNKQKVKFNREN